VGTKNRTIISLAALSTLALAAAGCSSSGGASSQSGTSASSSSSSSSPFTILFVGDTSGPTKVYGIEESLAVKSITSYLNAHGGIDGHHVVDNFVNDNGDAATAVSGLLNYLSSHSAPNFVYPGVESDVTTALEPVLAQHGLFSVSDNDGAYQLATDASTKFPYGFSIDGGWPVPTKAAADWFKSQNVSNVGILVEQDSYDQGETPYAISAFKADGIKAESVAFPATATDLTPELSQLRSSGAKGIFFNGIGPAGGYTLTGRSQLGWTVPVLFDRGASSVDVTSLVKPNVLTGGYEELFRPGSSALTLPGLSPLLAGMNALGGLPKGDNIAGAADAWDCVLLAANAADQAHSIKAADMALAMENLSPTNSSDPLYLASTVYGFSSNDHDNLRLQGKDVPILKIAPVNPTTGQVTAP
jgi:ABC-type branched-subunit amino acid transport system substrate-binding protein